MNFAKDKIITNQIETISQWLIKIANKVFFKVNENEQATQIIQEISNSTNSTTLKSFTLYNNNNGQSTNTRLYSNKPVQNFLQLKQYYNRANFPITFQVTEFWVQIQFTCI